MVQAAFCFSPLASPLRNSWATFGQPGGILSLLFVHRLDELFHTGGAFLLHLFGHVAVDIQGEGSGGVAQMLLDSFDIIAGSDGGNCIGVTEIVEPGFIQTNFLDDLLVIDIDGMSFEMLT